MVVKRAPMRALQAAEAVLAQIGKPLKADELTRRILAAGLWPTTGKTPQATINSELAVDIKRNGSASRFQRTGRGLFALRDWGFPEYTAASQPATSPATTIPVTVSPAAPPPSTDNATVPARSFTNAAEQVLERFADKKPMHYRVITEQALELGLIRTAGRTPEATMYAQILQEMARQTRRGETPRFTKRGRGLVGLTRWQGHGLAEQINQHNAEVRRKLLTRLQAMPPDQFETLIGQLLAALGFEEVTVTGRSGDGGVDVRGTLVVGDVIRTHMAVQVKRWKHNVQAPTVREVRGSLGTHDSGLIITTSDFASGAQEEAARPNAVPVGLMNGEQLVALLVERDIGVRRTSHDLIELGEAEE